MKALVFLITIIAATSTLLLSNEEDYIIWKYNNNSPIENAYFGGEEDEFIIIVGNNSIFKISAQDNQLIDSVNLPKGTASSAITNDGKELYVSIQEEILKYNVYDFNDVDSLTTIPLSGRLSTESVVNAYRMLKLSQDNRFLTCIYIEANGTERLTQILIYNLEQNIVIERFDHNKSNSNLIDFKIEYENPTFIEQDSKLIFSSITNSKDSLLSQVFILDYNSDELVEVDEARNRIHNNTDYFPLNENLINVSESSLPEATRFNILDINNLTIASALDFRNSDNYIAPYKPFKYNSNLFLVTLYNHSKQSSSFTILDISTNDTSLHYSNIPSRSGNLNISKNKELFISYSSESIFLHDLTKYIAETSVEHEYGEDILISPNPTADFLNIDTELILDELEVLNIEGKLIFTTNEKLIDISQLNSGVYYLVIKSGKQTVTKQFNVVR